MSELTIPRNYVTLRLTGTADAVAARVAEHRQSGRLVTMTRPRLNADGRVVVDLELLPPKPARRRRHVSVGAWVALAVGLVAAVVWLLYELYVAVVGFVTDHGPAILAGIVALAVLLLATGSSCAGLHCRGCRR